MGKLGTEANNSNKEMSGPVYKCITQKRTDRKNKNKKKESGQMASVLTCMSGQ